MLVAENMSKEEMVKEAVEEAKAYITEAIEHGFALGQGVGPVHHFYALYRKAGVNV